MGYIKSNLLPNERVVYRAYLHRKIFARSTFAIIMGAVVLALEPAIAKLLHVMPETARTFELSIYAAGGTVMLVGLLLGVHALLVYKTSEFGVTTERVIIKEGIVRRSTLVLRLRQIAEISVDQSITGRVLGFGSVNLTGVGGVRKVCDNIASPLKFQRKIQSRTT